MDNDGKAHIHGADYESTDSEYLAHRELKQGAAGWVLLTALGIAAVIAGHFAGWNYGIAAGGWGGMAVALILMGVMYFCMIFSLAELASIIPTAGGGYGFARRAFGPLGGYLTGIAIIFEYICAAAVIAVFIGAYTETLIGIGGWPVYLVMYSIFISVHIFGVGEALKLLLVLAVLAAAGILLFLFRMLPYSDPANLFDIAPVTASVGASEIFPMGYWGIWAALPFAMGMFLAVEAIPLASEETADPKKNVPKGMIAAMVLLTAFAMLIIYVTPAGAGAKDIATSDAPMIVAIVAALGEDTLTEKIINIAALIGLMASFFSIIFAYSRQTFSLSRAGYLPRFLSLTNKRKSPYVAIIVPGLVGILLSLTGAADQLLIILMFCATLSYIMIMAAHLMLRKTEPTLHRPFRTPGGSFTSFVALVLAVLAFISTILGSDPKWTITALALLAIFLCYFLLYSIHHLVAQAPEEEFEAIRKASVELGR